MIVGSDLGLGLYNYGYNHGYTHQNGHSQDWGHRWVGLGVSCSVIPLIDLPIYTPNYVNTHP